MIKNTYESMNSMAVAINRLYGIDEMAEVIKMLAGITRTGTIDDDKASIGRQAAHRWLTDRGYIS